jgi:hypothetical protein
MMRQVLTESVPGLFRGFNRNQGTLWIQRANDVHRKFRVRY